MSSAKFPASQPSVFSEKKDHALFLWIELKTEPVPKLKEVAKVCASLQQMVDKVTDPTVKDEILAGVGFGPTFYEQVGGKAKQDYNYIDRHGSHGEMLSSGGAVFVHAKCNTFSKLFELAQLFLKSLPADSVKDFEDIYGFDYRNGRDLSGFIDGTENPVGEKHRQKVAVENETGGSYVLTQKWIHNFEIINSTAVPELEAWVGRTMKDSTELKHKRDTAHLARITGGKEHHHHKRFEIVRQGMPFGTLKEGAGLFFLAYSASPENLNYMLDRMVGARDDNQNDAIMIMSKNVKGTFWYFPGVEELKNLE